MSIENTTQLKQCNRNLLTKEGGIEGLMLEKLAASSLQLQNLYNFGLALIYLRIIVLAKLFFHAENMSQMDNMSQSR
jgi:hypothetical protein